MTEDKGQWSFDINQSYGNDSREGFFEEDYFIENYQTANMPGLSQRLINSGLDRVTTAQFDLVRLFPEKNRLK